MEYLTLVLWKLYMYLGAVSERIKASALQQFGAG
jgi:hypothetical protein